MLKIKNKKKNNWLSLKSVKNKFSLNIIIIEGILSGVSFEPYYELYTYFLFLFNAFRGLI